MECCGLCRRSCEVSLIAECSVSGRFPALPPLQHPQRPQSIPPASRTHPLHLKISLTSIPVLQHPTPISALARANNLNSVVKTRIIRRINAPKIIKRPKNVVMPSRRKRKSSKFRLDDFARPVRPKQPVHQKKLTPASLRSPYRLHIASAVQLIQPQALKRADRRVNRSMRRPVRPPAIPPTVRHLLLQQVPRNSLKTRIVILKVGEDREHHPRNARLAPPRPFCPHAVIDAAVPLHPSIEKRLASRPRLLARGWQTKIPQQQHRISSGCPLRRVKPAIRRLPSSPSPRRILPRKKPRPPTLPRHPPPFTLHGPFCCTNQIPQNLPSNSRIPLKKPLDQSIALRFYSHAHNPVRPPNMPNQQTDLTRFLTLLRTRSARCNPIAILNLQVYY